MEIDWAWIGRNLDVIAQRTGQHIQLTLIAIGFGFIIAAGAVLLTTRRPVTAGPVLWFSGFLYTIPSLALFAALAPFTGLTVLTAEIALVSYTLLILIRNMRAGLDGVPESVRESARGMGFTDRRVFWAVDVPLSVPSVLAGLRIATVTIVGLVTVTSLLGMGGLGWFILNGQRRGFFTEIMVGAVLSVALAIVFDLVLILVAKRATPWNVQR